MFLAGQFGLYLPTSAFDSLAIEEIFLRPTTSDGLARLLAKAVALRAVGEAGSGDGDAARWDASVARQLGFAAGDLDLAAYGEAGALVSAALDPPQDPGVARVGNGVTRPVVQTKVNPHYAMAERVRKVMGTVILEAVIDEGGFARRPRILQAPTPRLALGALDGARGPDEPESETGRAARSARATEKPFHSGPDRGGNLCRSHSHSRSKDP